MRWTKLTLPGLLGIALACGGADEEPLALTTPPPADPPPAARQAADPPPADPPPAAAPGGAAAGVDATVVNPASNARIAIYEDEPSGAGPFPALVIMPAGVASGAQQKDAFIRALTGQGFLLIRFDPDGRGASTGAEDLGGRAHQAALREAVRYALAHPRVDPERVGVVSLSFGLNAAAGMLAADNPGARFLIDWEGPPSRAWTSCQKPPQPLAPFMRGCGDDAWWQEREAIRSLGEIGVPYLRMQSSDDHMHGSERGLALEAVKAAMEGGNRWVRLNDNPVNTPAAQLEDVPLPTFGPSYLPEAIGLWAQDLLLVAAGGTPPQRQLGMDRAPAAGAPPGQRGPGGRPGGQAPPRHPR